MLKQCLNSNLIPVVVKDKNKFEYYKALHLVRTSKDYDAFEK